MLIQLLQVLSGVKQINGISKNPKTLMQKLENINLALTFIRNQGIRLLNVGSSDINSGNMVIILITVIALVTVITVITLIQVPILGMIWVIILRYQINKKVHENQKGGDVGKRAVLKWVNKTISTSGIVVKNFTKNFQNPKVISLLVNEFAGEIIDVKALVGNNDDQVLSVPFLTRSKP